MSERAYWFGEQLKYGDGRIPEVGVPHTVDGIPVLCQRGLHASVHVFDALYYADCSRLWLVEIGGDVVRGKDKVVCTSRTYIASIEADCLLRDFARWCALQVLHLWDAPQVVKDYLSTGDLAIRSAARAATRDAAWSAAWSVARDAAWAAAEAATRDAAWGAAWSVARAAARAAAWAAAEAATMDAAWGAAEDGVEAAAWAATRDAVGSAARAKLAAMVDEAFSKVLGENVEP